MAEIILAARGRITTHFREDIGRGFPHNGIDQGHGDGLPVDLEIRAPADGVVIAHGWFGTYGNRLVIRHADGWTSLLAHQASQMVSTGDVVKQGQLIAVMGNTGTVYVHNHQELRLADGTQVDPLLNLGISTASTTDSPLPKEDTLSQAEVAQINDHADTIAAGIHAQLANIESLLAVEGSSGVDGGLRGQGVMIRAVLQNIENITAGDGAGSIRGRVASLQEKAGASGVVAVDVALLAEQLAPLLKGVALNENDVAAAVIAGIGTKLSQ